MFGIFDKAKYLRLAQEIRHEWDWSQRVIYTPEKTYIVDPSNIRIRNNPRAEREKLTVIKGGKQ